MELRLERLEESQLAPCTIRSWRDDDASSLVRHANNRRVWRNLRDSFPHPYTSDDAREWIDFASAQRPQINFTIAVDDTAVGGIGLELKTDVFRCSAEIGYWLGEHYWGRGIATEAVRILTTWAFSTFTLERIYAGVFGWNPASSRVLEKAGYEREAVLRNAVCKENQILDEELWATWPDRWQATSTES